MIAIDTNILVYSVREDSPWHNAALRSIRRVAAICRSNGVREIWTADRDYSRFSGLPVRNPLMSEES
jgi:predicted nucleic acid-binding protein